MKKVLFIDRDGTLIIEPPTDFQIDSLEKLSYLPGVFTYLAKVATEMDYELVMVSNQDGLGTASFPEKDFWPAQNKMLEALENEGIRFVDILIDRSFEEDDSPNRKPRTGMLRRFTPQAYDLENSFVIGDRISDVELAKNLGCKAIFIDPKGKIEAPGATTVRDWKEIYKVLNAQNRKSSISRVTSETNIQVTVALDSTEKSFISTGIGFFDHMLEQIAKHGKIQLDVQVIGDLEIDEHHTVEDTAISLGKAFKAALGKKVGIERYGYCLPMDDCLAQVAIDFGGRSWLEWNVAFKREMIGEMPTEMFFHFFKSFSDGAEANINIKAEGDNEHHKIEAVFKAFAKAIKMAIKQDANNMELPSTKGVL